MPKVSIITPTYNGEKFIERAIKSVLWQTFKDWEMIIVDDASNDKTVKIVKEYAQKDSRIKLIELKENTGGPAIPRTIACKEAMGEYIAFLDQDDIYYPEYLELKINYLEKHPEIDILSSLAWTFDEETKKIIYVEHGGPVNTIVRKIVIIEGDYFKPEEVDEIGCIFRYLIVKNNFKRHSLLSPEPITLYSRHPSQNSYVENKDAMKFVKRIEALINEFDEGTIKKIGDKKFLNYIKYVRKIWYSRLGNFYCLANKLLERRKAFKNSLKIGFYWFSLFFLLLSYLGFEPYRKIEYFLRIIQRKLFWRTKVFVYKLKYPESYKKAKQILSKLL
ncbi:Putative glycosyltransferase EpsE [bacterium HR35]|nr:Putative glycosyltransferase EpsE [bacterium HR35]